MRGRARLWLIGFVLSRALVVHAEPPEAKTEATRLSDEGAEALNQHEPARALAAFDAALRLYPSAKLHYNRGLALDALERPAEAATAFERFVGEARDAPAAQREYAARRLGELEPLCGHARLALEPARARVTLDGQPVAAAAQLRLAPGPHLLAAELEGYQDGRRRFDAPAGATVDVALRLEARPAAAPQLVASSRAARPAPQLYRRWWLWTIVGGVVAAGVVTTAVLLAPPAETRPRGSLGDVSPMF